MFGRRSTSNSVRMNFASLQLLMVIIAADTLATKIYTKSGTLQGWTGLSRDGREYLAFSKIPFAKPPVGDLRFKNPIPFGSWEGILNATDDLPFCYQFDAINISGSGYRVVGTEDCLYLNVYVPKGISKKVPVLFYIHGGGFQLGYPGGRNKAKFLMDEDVILVAATYRLNLFGFFSLEDESVPGNFGLKDQAMALRWVKENIHSFGGDPDRIVIFGESAGGASAHHLLLSPSTKDLISGAMSISGTTRVWGTSRPGNVRKASLRLAKSVGCSGENSGDLLTCLQNVDAKAWEGPLRKPGFGEMLFFPCVEPDAPGAVVLANNLNSTPKAPWITSFTNGEYLIALLSNMNQGTPRQDGPQNFTSIIEKLLYKVGLEPSPKTNEIIKRVEAKYRGGAEEIDIRLKLSFITSDYVFTFAALDALNLQAGTKYFNVFEHRGERSAFDAIRPPQNFRVDKACHADELLYLFDTSPRVNNSVMNAIDLKVSKDYIKLLTNFAYYQNPTPKGSAFEWKPWTTKEVLRITSRGNFMGDSEYYDKLDDVYKFWKDISNFVTEEKDVLSLSK